MAPDRGPGEIDAVAFARDADQRKVRSAAAHVADQHDLPIREQPPGAREVVRDPGVERRRRFFEKREAGESGFRSGADGQLAGFLIERSRNRQDDFVLAQRAETPGIIPRIPHGRKKARRNLHGREHAPAFARIPGQNVRGAIHIRIRKPGLRAMDEPRRDKRALIPRVSSYRLAFFEQQERRQGAARLRAAGRDNLRDIEDVNRRKAGIFGLGRIDPGERGVGGTEVYADFHSFRRDAHTLRAGTALSTDGFNADYRTDSSSLYMYLILLL